MNKTYLKTRVFFLIKIFMLPICIFFLLSCDNNKNIASNEADKAKLISIGNDDAPVEIKIYSSLTCPHCANFHINVVQKIKDKYVKNGNVKIFFMDFPLDIAALNAAKILHCIEKDKQMRILDLIYKNQKEWVVESDIKEINNRLKKITTTSGINSDKIDNCLIDETIENKVLNARINGQKKYSISSTPTIIINEEKLEGNNDFESIEKIIKKII